MDIHLQFLEGKFRDLEKGCQRLIIFPHWSLSLGCECIGCGEPHHFQAKCPDKPVSFKEVGYNGIVLT